MFTQHPPRLKDRRALLWNHKSSVHQSIDIFCVSQPALVGCDDDAQISGEHEEEGEQSVSLRL